MFTILFLHKNSVFAQNLLFGNYLTKKCVLFKVKTLRYDKVKERDQALVLPKVKFKRKTLGGIYYEQKYIYIC